MIRDKGRYISWVGFFIFNMVQKEAKLSYSNFLMIIIVEQWLKYLKR